MINKKLRESYSEKIKGLKNSPEVAYRNKQEDYNPLTPND